MKRKKGNTISSRLYLDQGFVDGFTEKKEYPAHWVLPDTKGVTKVCGNMIKTRQLVAAQYGELCVSLARAELHYQLDCAALLGVRLQKDIVSNNIYNLFHITWYSPSSEVFLQVPF